MYALHPDSLPPKTPESQERRQVTAADLVRLYKLQPHDYIVWDPNDGYDWWDFIHLYPSFYGRYDLLTDGTPEKDIPCGFTGLGPALAGRSPASRVDTLPVAKTRKRS